MTPRERAYLLDNDLSEGGAYISELGQAERLAKIQFAITADRSQLEGEIVKRLRAAENVNPEERHIFVMGIGGIHSRCRDKPERHPVHGGDEIFYTQAESNRLILAEREACALLADKYADECYEKIDKVKGWKRRADKENEMMNFHDLSKEIRSRSNPEQGSEPLPSLTPFDPSCSTCVREAKEEAEESAKEKSAEPDRIAVLHSLLGEQAETINHLLEENHALQKKLSFCAVRDDNGSPVQPWQCAP